MRRCGSELWLDSGDMDAIGSLWCAEFTALTTNNTLLNREVQKGIYDELVAKAAAELRGEVPEEDLALEIAFVLNAYHGLRLHREFGAMVSVELHTDLAHDVERTVAYARRYYEIAPAAFYIKIPMTPAGLLAARRLGDEGIPVNYTLGFSARQNYLITAVARPAFVNVFLGRLNSFFPDNELGSGEMVGEKATLASQRAVRELRDSLGAPTRQIAASLRAGAQVVTLAGVDVLTIPPKAAAEFEQPDEQVQAAAPDADMRIEVEAARSDEAEALRVNVLWDVPQDLRRAVGELMDTDLSALRPQDVIEFFAERGSGDLLPHWSQSDIEAASAEGKIPRYARWKQHLARAEIGLDALMSICALQSFAADQKAMDDRIRSML